LASPAKTITMRIAILLLFSGLCMLPRASAQQLTIIESTSFMPAHEMDSVWLGVATSMGYTAQIAPQSTLDDIAGLAATDVLILSSGVIALPAARLHTLYQYTQSGRPCFVQSEYLANAEGSITFDSLMNAINADFQWIVSQSGDLAPVTVSGTLATTPNAVGTLNYFWYGCTGGGTGVQSFLEANGSELGWVHAADASSGMVITTSDQDWVKEFASLELMENILFMLVGAANGITANDAASPITVQQSSVDGRLLVTSTLNSPCTFILRDARGRELQRTTLGKSATLDLAALSTGTYVYEVRTRDGRAFGGKVLSTTR